MKVLIMTADSNGGYPVPAVKGGAVSTLVEHLVAGNNEKQLCNLEVLSLYDADAREKADKQYQNVKFSWVIVPEILKFFDKCAFSFIRLFKRNEKSISFRSPFSLLYYIIIAKRIANKTDADKIVLENNIPLARVMKRSKFTGQWYYHLHNVPRIDAGCRNEFQRVTKFLCVSRFVANQITGENSAIGRIDPEKTCILYNCVDTKLFRPIDNNNPEIKRLKDQYGFSEDDFICIFAGRLSEEKGADKLLKALQNTSEHVKCLVVGGLFSSYNTTTPYLERLREAAAPLNGRVYFTGYVDQKDLPYYYNISDVAVLPSIWDEPAGLTNLEAMACGIPVITTDAGGIPEYVSEGNAIIIRERDAVVDEISKNINLMVDNAEAKYDEKRDYIKSFDAERYIESFLVALESIK